MHSPGRAPVVVFSLHCLAKKTHHKSIDLGSSSYRGAPSTRSRAPVRDRVSPSPQSGHRRRKSTSDASTSRSASTLLHTSSTPASHNPSPPPREPRRQRKSASDSSTSRSSWHGGPVTPPPHSLSPPSVDSRHAATPPAPADAHQRSPSDNTLLGSTMSSTTTTLSSTRSGSPPSGCGSPPSGQVGGVTSPTSASPLRRSKREHRHDRAHKATLVSCLSADGLFRWRFGRARALRRAAPAGAGSPLAGESDRAAKMGPDVSSHSGIEVMVAKRAPSVTQRTPSATQCAPSAAKMPSVTLQPLGSAARSAAATGLGGIIPCDGLSKTWPGRLIDDTALASEFDDAASIQTCEEEDPGQLRGLYPEALLVLKMLVESGVKVAVVSRCSECAGDRAMISLGIDRYCALRVFNDEPRDAQLNAVAKLAGRSADDLIYFDMSSTNVAMCERTGAYPVCVSKQRGVTRDVVERACKGAAMHKTLTHALMASRRAG